MMGGGMMGGSCASCHGLNGQGRTTSVFTAPNITYSNLTDPKGMLAPDGSRGPTYTDATLRRAVASGIDPSGDHLASPMPQWQLTSQEWSDLLAYLKTLR
jgi:mono/diheme cytochrome c family protein